MIFEDIFSSCHLIGRYLTSVDDKVTGFANTEVNGHKDVIFFPMGPPECYAWGSLGARRVCGPQVTKTHLVF